MGQQKHWSRLTSLGIPSLLALFFGGTILVFTGINGLVLTQSMADAAIPDWYRTANDKWRVVGVGRPFQQFRVGARLGIQAWLAIIGVGFGLVSYGATEAYHHAFDWWCSRKASGTMGLDYARYLNTQPRSPVVYGFRGFIQFITLRYLVTTMAIVASIGYKFGVSQTPIAVGQHFYKTKSAPSCPIAQAAPDLLSLIDSQGMRNNPRFYHESLNTSKLYEPFRDDGLGYYNYSSQPPARVVMLGQLWCLGYRLPDGIGSGTLIMVEPIVVASLSEEAGNFTMTRDAGDWQRSLSWVGHERPALADEPPQGPQTPDLVIDYRIKDSEDPRLEIQWATAGPWLNDSQSQETQPVHHRLIYKLGLGTAEVRRQITEDEAASSILPNQRQLMNFGFGSNFGSVDRERPGAESLRLLSMSEKPVPWRNATTESMPHLWIDVALSKAIMRPMECANVILHFAMAEWRLQNEDTIREDDAATQYFHMPDILASSRQISEPRQPLDKYPFFVGNITDGAGCHRSAAIVFITVGLLAIIVGVIRLIVGPPRLTSWAAQHIALSQSGMIRVEHTHTFQSGYSAVPSKSGVLRLEKTTKAATSDVEKGKDNERSLLRDSESTVRETA